MGRWRISSSTLLTVEASCCLSITRHLVYRRAGTASGDRLLSWAVWVQHRLQVTRSVEWEGASVRAVFSSVTATSGAGEGAWTRAGSRPSPGLAITFCATSPCCRSASSAPVITAARTEATSPAIFTTIQPEPLVFSGEQRDGGRFRHSVGAGDGQGQTADLK